MGYYWSKLKVCRKLSSKWQGTQIKYATCTFCSHIVSIQNCSVLRMLGIAFVVGALCVWLYTHNEHAKNAFVLSLGAGVIHFTIKFILHRREWSKYVTTFPVLIAANTSARTSTFVLLGTSQGIRRSNHGSRREFIRVRLKITHTIRA